MSIYTLKEQHPSLLLPLVSINFMDHIYKDLFSFLNRAVSTLYNVATNSTVTA